MANDPTPATPPVVPPVVVAPPVPAPVTVSESSGQDSLYSQAFIYAACMLPIAAGVLIGSFKYLSPEVASTLAGTALGLTLGGPTGYFFGAAKHPTGNSPATPPTTTTVTAPPATVTTTTGAAPGTAP